MNVLKRLLLGAAPIFLFLLLWELLSKISAIGTLVSSPPEVGRALLDLVGAKTPSGYPVLLVHIATSLYRLALAFLAAVGLGIGLGALAGRSKIAYRFFDPLVTVLMPVPGIAWAPLFLVWLGFGNPTIITVGIIAAFFPIFYNTASGVRSVDQNLVRAAEIVGANARQKFLKVYLPGAAAHILTGLKLGLARCWRTIIAVEMIAASLWGLGFMIFDARDYLRPSVIYGGIAVLALIYLALENTVFKWIERRTVERWGMVVEGVVR